MSGKSVLVFNGALPFLFIIAPDKTVFLLLFRTSEKEKRAVSPKVWLVTAWSDPFLLFLQAGNHTVFKRLSSRLLLCGLAYVSFFLSIARPQEGRSQEEEKSHQKRRHYLLSIIIVAIPVGHYRLQINNCFPLYRCLSSGSCLSGLCRLWKVFYGRPCGLTPSKQDGRPAETPEDKKSK